MNFFSKTMAVFFPTAVLNRRADKLLAGKPSGFHPVRKRVYRRECREMLGSYQKMLGRRMEGRILGNKGVSVITKYRMDKLKSVAR